MTKTSKKDDIVLEKVPCIHYLLQFQKDNVEAKALINSNSKVNAMTQAYISKLSLRVRYTNIGAQKINSFTFEIFEMVLASFQVEDKFGKAQFF